MIQASRTHYKTMGRRRSIINVIEEVRLENRTEVGLYDRYGQGIYLGKCPAYNGDSMSERGCKWLSS